MTRITTSEIAILAEGLDIDVARLTSVHDLQQLIGAPDESIAYLVLGVLTARIPTDDEVRSFTREWRASDLLSVISGIPQGLRRRSRRTRVRLARGFVVDVTDTARSHFTTGIQRVARETLSRWSSQRTMDLIVWDVKRGAFVGANEEESARATLNTVLSRGTEIVIPFRSAFFLPEIAVDVARATALLAVAVHSRSATSAIGFDCIPVTTAETAGPGMPGAFSRYLSTLARFSVVVPISDAAGAEYSGWRAMLAGAGLVGPEIRVVPLPSSIALATQDRPLEKTTDLEINDDVIVLGVGSREPRKNHLSLLHACELNWQAGREFALVLVGGNAWETRRVDALISDLRRRGRSIVVLSSVDDSTLDDLYERSRFTVFCSLNEGFGLPIIESLSRGKPVLTSQFGSMRQLGEGRGALLVDPHNPKAMASGMARLLDDDTLLAALGSQARGVVGKSWDDYAIELDHVVAAADETKGRPDPRETS